MLLFYERKVLKLWLVRRKANHFFVYYIFNISNFLRKSYQEMVITITSIFFGKEPDSKYSSVSSIEIATVILISFESKCCFIFVLFLFFIVIFFCLWNYLNLVIFLQRKMKQWKKRKDHQFLWMWKVMKYHCNLILHFIF